MKNSSCCKSLQRSKELFSLQSHLSSPRARRCRTGQEERRRGEVEERQHCQLKNNSSCKSIQTSKELFSLPNPQWDSPTTTSHQHLTHVKSSLQIRTHILYMLRASQKEVAHNHCCAIITVIHNHRHVVTVESWFTAKANDLLSPNGHVSPLHTPCEFSKKFAKKYFHCWRTANLETSQFLP